MGHPHGVGIVGLGVISRAYLDTLVGHPDVRIVAVADLDAERARTIAETVPGARALSVPELLADPEVDTVLNLTIPAAHAEIAHGAISHGKNVYGEKPLTAVFGDARTVMASADAAGVHVGCAPDTVLGTGVQTARAAIDAGHIGRPVAATAAFVSAGHESWHPNPDFYYLPGGGPLFDMGPYYLSALVHMLGPVVAVQGAGSRTRSVRTIGSGPREGETFDVDVATHVTGVLTHADGALSTVTFSFDAHASEAKPIEVHGEAGSLSVPDPNYFDGDVRLSHGDGWQLVPVSAGYEHGSRGVGLLDFAAGESPARRASGELALHTLEVMTLLLESAETGERRRVSTAPERPEPVPLTTEVQWRRLAGA
ncbi:putative dehydrogenase [Microbacterium endophyticum]|uniref:Putative dehydrogenase n=1 Tax=Microbacterium endophyticum TaxID=1526412 RepID=A0A7W4V2U3_9MICO|nr:Gfo/Idh/MocA family oxidoreductase [Microbacterium endophyticum]MBB2975305.1 putative dehydrogenase [Microbacterium endophyticum]NIK35676.1 putative dehydrogenase [Microbacterium endophyticum]